MRKSYFNSAIPFGLDPKSSKIFRLLLMVILFLISSNTVFGQAIGDYRSRATGNWTTLNSWEYWNGSSWGIPTGTSPQGYPGQYAGTGAVSIATGHKITINSTLTTISFGTLTITGTLFLDGDNSTGGMDMSLTTQNIIVTPSAGFIEFDKKVNLILPANAILQVTTGGLDTSSGCSANQIIYIGGAAYSKCTGGGSLPNFTEIMAGGGTLNTTITTTTPVCESDTINLNGGITNTGWTIVSYSWSIVPPSGAVITATTQNLSIPTALVGTYVATLTVTAKYGSSNNYSNIETASVIVNAKPTITGPFNVCIGTAITLTGIATPHPTTPWASSAPGFASISSAGVVTGIAAGSTVITYMNSNGCTQTATVIVGSLVNNTGTGFSSSTFCEGTQATITFNADDLSGKLPYTVVYQRNSPLATYSETITTDAATNIILSPNPLVTTDYTLISITDANGCTRTSGFGNATATATINTMPTTPVVGAITHPGCGTPTGSVVLSSLPPSGTINQTGTVVTTYPITAASMTISGLIGGTYNYSVTRGACTTPVTAAVVINSLVTNTWNGVSWDNGTPDNNQTLIFTGDYPPAIDPNVDIEGCACTVTSGANVSIKTGRTLKITNAVTVNAGSTLTVENHASLVQINDAAVNSGNIIYKRITPSLIETDYTYWSSPVAGQVLEISPDYTYGYFYSFSPAINNWVGQSPSTVMTPCQGYIIRGQRSDNTAYNITATFTGVPNNGVKTIAIGATGTSNLIGNPYPSAIDADDFLSTNSAVIEGTIYFWTHRTAIQAATAILDGTAGSGTYAYTSNDYASYNTTGGVATGNKFGFPLVEEISNRPTGKIGAGQSFFATSKTAGTATFDNSMRLGAGGVTLLNTQFFKTKNSKSKTAAKVEKNRVWLNLTNTKGAFKQTLLGYVTGATNAYEDRFDGATFDGNDFVDFYSINDSKNLVIQGRAVPFDENDVVALGYKTAISGTFSIGIDQVDGVLENQNVYLEDKLTKTEMDLKTGKYTFETTKGTFNNRFVLKYKTTATLEAENSKTTLSSEDFETKKEVVVILVENNQIKIDALAETIDKILVYDITGKLLYQNNEVDSSVFVTPYFVSNHQNLLVKIRLQNGKEISKKLVY